MSGTQEDTSPPEAVTVATGAAAKENGVQSDGDRVQQSVRSDEGMKIVEELIVTTEEIDTELKETFISNEIFPDDSEFQDNTCITLKNVPLNNESNGTDPTLTCTSKQLLPLDDNMSYKFEKIKDTLSNVNHIPNPDIYKINVNDISPLKTELSLNDAFENCIFEFTHDLDEDFYERLNFKFNKNISSPNTHTPNKYLSNNKHQNRILPTYKHPKNIHHSPNLLKTKLLLTDNSKTLSNFSIENDHSYFNPNKASWKIFPTIKVENSNIDIPRPTPKSRQEITVGIPNIFFDQSSEVEYFKKTLKKFMQKCICLSLPPEIEKCIECQTYKMKTNLTKRDYENIACRFYAFRQLRFMNDGKLCVAGHLDPFKDIQSTDIDMWLPKGVLSIPSDFNIEVSKKILEDIGGQFCKFVEEEEETSRFRWPIQKKKRKIAWKKCVNGVREMCDICKTTIFNYHWSCGKCGFVVCADCYKCKYEVGKDKKSARSSILFNKKKWLPCSDQKDHKVDLLLITQIIAGDTLNFISRLMHQTCRKENILLDCNCNQEIHVPSIDPNIFSETIYKNDQANEIKNNKSTRLNDLLKIQYYDYCNTNKEASEKLFKEDPVNNFPRKHVILPSDRTIKNSNRYISKKQVYTQQLSLFNSNLGLSYQWLCEGRMLYLLDPKHENNYELFQDHWKHGQPVLVRGVGDNLNQSLWHPRSFSRDFGQYTNDLIDCSTGKVVSDQPMSLFWDGFEDAALRLRDKQGDPMLLKLKDWPPSADFAETLPDRFRDLMACLPLHEYTHRSGALNLASRLPNCFVPPDLGPKMYTAYGTAGGVGCGCGGKVSVGGGIGGGGGIESGGGGGIESGGGGGGGIGGGVYNRWYRGDGDGRWCSGDSDGRWYRDDGDCGWLDEKSGTTNLHLDMSDAVNVMVYVAVTRNCPDGRDREWHERRALRAVYEAGCDDATAARLSAHGETPGALWHIYHASDADAIRDLLIRVAIEHGRPIDECSDPIHDQSHYLDEYLRERLYHEYDVKGYAVVQCYGDAVFIPAGAPHQVKNLHNCIKVAEDFVSPENVHHSCRMTQEFRKLTDSHTNHEDKLQIKNILFHAVKDSLAVLTYGKEENNLFVKN